MKEDGLIKECPFCGKETTITKYRDRYLQKRCKCGYSHIIGAPLNFIEKTRIFFLVLFRSVKLINIISKKQFIKFERETLDGLSVPISECPFCGGKSNIIINGINKYNFTYKIMSVIKRNQIFSVSCQECGAMGECGANAEIAARDWNIRYRKYLKVCEDAGYLKNCPFCGSEARLKEFCGSHFVSCNRCECSTESKWKGSQKEAIQWWNTRSNPNGEKYE